MNEQKVYQKIGELLWSIMPQEAKIIYFTGKIYSTFRGWGTDFTLKNGITSSFDFGQEPTEIEWQIRDLMDDLINHDLFKDKWNHYKISLTEEGKFNIDFAYIPESDDWVNLYMKGVSDLKREELDEHNIPLEEWEKRVELKKKNKL